MPELVTSDFTNAMQWQDSTLPDFSDDYLVSKIHKEDVFGQQIK